MCKQFEGSSEVSGIPSEAEKLEDQKKLDRVAEEAAEQAGKTEQRYDQQNDIFTK
jgi:hypothetical protein